MQRRKFIASATAATILGASATRSAASHRETAPPKKAFTVKAGETRFGERTPFRVVNANDLKISSKDTNGALSVFEYVGKEKVGPPLHLHLEQDEIFYVVEGEYRFQVGDEKLTAKAGDTVFGPRTVPHTWVQVSDSGKLIYSVQPAGTMEAFFSELNGLKRPPTEAEVQHIHVKHGMKVLGPPIALN